MVAFEIKILPNFIVNKQASLEFPVSCLGSLDMIVQIMGCGWN